MKFSKEFEKEISPLLDKAGIEDKDSFIQELENLYGTRNTNNYIEKFSKERYLNVAKWRSKPIYEYTSRKRCTSYSKKN